MTVAPTDARLTTQEDYGTLSRRPSYLVGITNGWEVEMTAVEPELIEEMFVQVASGSSSTDGALTLTGLSPSTLYFSDRPERIVGHMTTAQFIDQWAVGDNSFASDPPNAVLSWVDSGDARPEDCVVVLKEPKAEGDSIRYTIDLLEGSVPASSGACTLFIDPLGRPLSPVSVAGMHRRDRRRRR
jgi:hypothetical protein